MELLQDQLEEKNLTPVHVVRRHVSPQTIIMRLGTKLNLAKYPTYQVTNAIGVAAGLTASECTICFTIGHRADVCPTDHEFTRCETCGQQFRPAQRPDQTAHECEVRCFNCEGPHGARDPRCPKKQQADKLTRLAAERRRLKTTSKDSGQPKNRQSSQSIASNTPKKNDQNYTSLPLHNRFEALRDTTPDPKSEPRPRSGSLPGYPTKRSTPPTPPPNPKVLCGPCSPRSRPRIPKNPRRSNPGTPPQKRHSSPAESVLHSSG
ncbi:hypothetical protein HPB49_021897 [Dermacentor silvarum]|uniref:Uncharacterized protein n=1 Tax=Dermacentor silvarum TaxID=543639 RepID=A0ACB8CHR3_DERSI|nr:hypothetical protein HPB49_021897 [Dermacentor silvarum]